MRNHLITLIATLLLTIVSALVVWPKGPNFFSKEIKMNLGLDLQGGVQLIYEIQTDNLGDKTPQQAQQETIDLISRRINSLGVSEPQIQSTKIQDKYGVIIELPGIKDIGVAKDIIGKTAQLKFLELDGEESLKETGLTGADVKKAIAGTDQGGTGFSAISPIIELEFTNEGATKFQEITKRNINKPIITMLDEEIINQATVKSEISGGKAQIEGIETLKEAKETAQLINEGALPAPIKMVQESQVGATLGQDAIEKSIVAGIFGLILVAIFMVAYYGKLGLVAVYALAVYTLIVTAIFKIIPVTLTLAGIAGFIFSIGAAVDANILIFERYKEESKKGIERAQAFENGFARSWPSIRDSNIASFITAGILFYMSTGIVRGFAVTLAIGIAVSMFTSITVTRNVLRFFIKSK